MKKWTAKGMSCVPFRSCNQHVEYVDKRHQSLSSIPDETFRYARTLEELLLDANHIRELPKQLVNLTRLRKLCLSDNEIRELPPNLGNLGNLAELDVSRNEIQTIPTSIQSLTRMRILDLSSNPISVLPPSFCAMKSLTTLTLNDTALTELPEGFGNLTSLVSVELRENALRGLPPSFESLRNLERLDLGDNELTDLPPFIGKLTKLVELWLDHNLLFRLPKEIGNLEKLMCLDVSENQLDELPDEVGNLRSLTDFIASQNNLDRLPPTFGQLSNLTVLKFEQNKLSKIHPSFGMCTKIQELFLRENLLEEVGDWITSLANLKILNMDCNRISSVTEKIENLKSLGVLSLRMNLIERLPHEIGACGNLMVIDVSGNRLQNLPFTITSLSLLKAVWLSENQSQPMPHFSTDYVLSEPVLTCYLLPQLNSDSSQQNQPDDDRSAEARGERDKFGLPIMPPSDPSLVEIDMSARNTTVKFQDRSDDESSVNGTESESTGFVRHNTPHPRDLKAKFQKWFGGAKPKSKTVDKVFVAPDENENSKGPFRPERQKVDPDLYAGEEPHKSTSPPPQAGFREMEENRTDTSEAEETEEADTDENAHNMVMRTHDNISYNDNLSDDSKEEKHVGFDVDYRDESEEYQQEERVNLRLHRRDTPHHLKNKRINAEGGDADTLKAILQRVQQRSTHEPKENPNPVESQRPPENDVGDSTNSTTNKQPQVLPITKTLQLILNREVGHPFGLNIAGGLGSSPFMDNDQSIFISKVVPGGLAEAAGLEAADRVINVNGVDFTNIEHKAAVDAIRQAGSKIVFIVERKVSDEHPAPVVAAADNHQRESLQSPAASSSFHPNSGRISGTSSKENLTEVKALVTIPDPEQSSNVVPPHQPSPNLVFPCPKPYKGISSFDAMIPSEVKAPSAVVTVTIKQPDAVSERVSDIFLPAPTDLGTVTETITKSTLTETVFTRVTHNEPVMVPLETEIINIDKSSSESLGVKIVSGSDEDCYPFGNNQAGVFVVYLTKNSPAARCGLRIGHRIIEINGRLVDPTDKNKIAVALLEAGNNIELKIRKHPPPPGFLEVDLTRAEGEPLGMHIKGGTDNPGNPLRKNDSGIFISKILPNGAISRCGIMKVGMQILSVNGHPLLNVTHNDAVNVLRGAGSEIEMMVANGYDPNEVDRLRAEGKLPDKIVEVLSNSEEAAAAAAKVSAANHSPVPESKELVEAKGPVAKPSVDKVMEVVRAAEQLVVPSSPTGFKDKGTKSSSSTAVAPSSPGFDVRKTTVVMTGHSLTSPGLGGQRKFHDDDTVEYPETLEPKPRTHLSSHENATYANLNDLHHSSVGNSSEGGLGRERSESAHSDDMLRNGEREDVFIDSDGVNGGVEARNPVFNGNSNNLHNEIGLPPVPPGGYRQKMVPTQLPLGGSSIHSDSSNDGKEGPGHVPPVPTPRTSIGSIGGRSSPSPLEEGPKELRVKIKDLSPKTVNVQLTVPLAPSDEFEPEEQEPVFQFKPAFHRVPSPIFNTPFVTFIPPEAAESTFSNNRRTVTPQKSDDSSAEEVFNSVPPPPPEVPPPPKDTNGQTISDVRASTVSARAKFFEQEIQQLSTTSNKPATKQFSFLSQYEVDRMKQEEEQKIAAIGGSMDVLRTTELEQVVEEDEDFYLEELNNSGDMDGNDEKLRGGSHGDISTTSGLGDSSTRINASSRASGQTRSISASSISSISSTGSIRTAKAERRLNDKLSREGSLRGIDPTLGMDLSPSEQRALQAEKRAAWRKARLKSLEQDAVQAQMVLNRMNELIDGSPTGPNSNNQSAEEHGSTEKLDNDGNVAADEENNVSIKNTSKSSTFKSKSYSSSTFTSTNEPFFETKESSSSDSELPNVHFPSLYIRKKSAGPKKVVGERERVVGEKVSRKTQEWFNEATGNFEIRTVEIIEKIIEHEVETTEQKIISIELDSPLKSPSSVSGEEPTGSNQETPNSSGGNTNGGKRKKRKGSKKK
ncbi:Protein lap4 [Orchesella cincta]|uniref:Protein lap4 n=1 Tax=Orchesella cincta TaxID=48709 RepID=A0A1D2N6Y2_ORCCI|nr:Protein lap4 [Orchesella cincta]